MRAFAPGDLVKTSSFHIEPDPVGVVLSIVETVVRPPGQKPYHFKVVWVLWPEPAVGRWAGISRRINDHLPTGLLHADQPQ